MNSTCSGGIKIFSCNANRELASQIADKLEVELGQSVVEEFSDGEISIAIKETVRGNDVFIIQPTSPPVNKHLMELLIMIDAMRRASAGRITAVMPYFGYARQDRKAKARDPISAKLVANLITEAGADRILTMDLHSDQLQGFFDIPVDHLRGMLNCANYYSKRFDDFSDVIVVSPDLGSVGRARALAEHLDVPLAIVDKRRPKANESEVMNIIGKVRGKSAILLDDMIDTGGSIVNAATALMEKEAKEVYAACTHGIFSGNALEKITNSPIKEMVALNTVDIPEDKRIPKLKVISVASVFAESIKIIHDNTSISRLFDKFAPPRVGHK